MKQSMQASPLSICGRLKQKLYCGVLFAAIALSACGGTTGSPTVTTLPVVVSPPPAPPVITRPETPDPAPIGPDFHPVGKGWSLTWSDEFDGTALDPQKWASQLECWGGGNNEKQCYTQRTDNVEVVNGLLRLIALEESYTGPNRADDTTQTTQPYTSGKVLTRGLADWTYGRFEFRAKLPEGQGAWPAFWMLGATETYGDTWPLYGEIDIMEAINLGARCDTCSGSDGENRTSAAIHYGSEFPNNQYVSERTQLDDNSNPADGYHVWAVEWGEGLVQWFLDGELYYTTTNDMWYTDGDLTNPNAPFDASFYLILNLAIGGNYPEPLNEMGIAETVAPNQFLIDWVRVYQCSSDLEKGLACMDVE